MPLTRPITCEEDISMSLSTTVSGLVAKYNSNGKVDAKALLGSIVANCCLGVNQLIDECPMTFTEKSQFRADLKTLCGRAFRAKLGVVNASGQAIEADALDSSKGDKDK